MSSYRNLLLLILSLSFVPLFTACDPTPEELCSQGYNYELRICPWKSDEENQENFKKAFECFKQAAEQGYAKAYSPLGRCYYVDDDYQQAVKWFRKAAEDYSLSDEDKGMAQCYLGRCYSRGGKGISKDYVEAVKWFRLVAEKGDCEAQWNLGLCYFYGDGVVEDKEKAVYWYRKAAENEKDYAFSILACSSLGECYAFGYGVPKDIQKAIELWQKAVEADRDAQYYLGVCYAEGLGVPKDLDKAVELLHEADKRGHEKAGKVLDQLTNRGY